MARIFSGIQPSGSLHIGNYLGAVKNWVELQHKYESFFCIVDYHAITVPYEPADLRVRTAWIFNTLTPLGELERQTQFKEKASREESVPAGLLNYPVLQAADILLYRAELVPVGEDQLQHLELSREIARKWNARFGDGFFPEPKGLLTPTRRIMGLDGVAKMSKSLGNTVDLLEDPTSIWEKLRPAVTDPARVRRTDPGTPEVCNIYHLHKAFSPPATVEHVAVQCRTAGWGCIDCKKEMKDVLAAGAGHARAEAQKTMTEVKKKMGLT